MPDYNDPSSPPGPVGTGPGYWTFDAWGGGWRNDWIPNGQGGYMIQGSGDGSGGAAGPGAMPDLARIRRSEQSSPHFNPQLAGQWAAQHPGGNTPPLYGQTEGDYNPDIWALAHPGITANQGQSAGAGDRPAGGPMPPGAGGPTTGATDYSGLLASALGSNPAAGFGDVFLTGVANKAKALSSKDQGQFMRRILRNAVLNSLGHGGV